ncbi:MAG: hypothetical protein KDK70_38485, partial [Myxococcales bacterium]|nr:hypothetical protein [Myxococcales bacterium]
APMPRSTLALLALLGLAAACPKPAPSPTGDGPSGDPATVPGGAIDPGSASAGGATPSTADGCRSDADCDGGVCEGQGCGEDQLGTCMPQDRMCTRDSVVYCGCDGTTFRASGSCPGRRYAARGECTTAPPVGGGADGASCLAASDCQSGVCEGQGCGDDQPGTCVPQSRMCTRDLQAYCGCDGATFRTSGSCPGQRYAARGECTTAPSKGGG